MVALAQTKGSTRREDGAEPRTLGPYRLVERLGESGLDAVYLARIDGPHRFQRWVALRVVEGAGAHDQARVRELCEAARTAASIVHPNFTTVFDVGESDGRWWVATELLLGESAHEILSHAAQAAVPVPWSIATRIVADAADALAAMHALRGPRGESLGLIHGSLDARSLIVTYAGTTKLEPSFKPTPDGGVRDDVSALAAILWELCAGRHLGANDARARRGIPSLASLVAGVPESVDTIIQRALGNIASAPMVTARELARALRGALVVEGIVVEDHDVGRYVRSRFADRFAQREAQLQEADDDLTEVFRFGAIIEDAPDTERELPKLDDDDDEIGVQTLPFRRRGGAPTSGMSFVKAQRVIVIDAPPAPLPARVIVAPQKVRETAPKTLPMRPRLEVPELVAIAAAPAPPPAPIHVASIRRDEPVTKRPSRWPGYGAAVVFLVALFGGGLFLVQNPRYLALVRGAPSASAKADPSPTIAAPVAPAPSLVAVAPPESATTPAPIASAPPPAATSTARASRPIAWARPVATQAPLPPPRVVAAPPAAPTPRATGKLTVICLPACDDVLDGGRSLGPSPVFKVTTDVGPHQLTLVVDDPPMKKQVTVTVEADETALVRAQMK